MIARARNLLRAYFAGIALIAFGSLCFAAGIASATTLAIVMVKAMTP